MTETSFTIPVVETKRLVLRAHSADDLDHSFALWSHPTTARFIGALTTTRAEAWQRLLRYPGLWAVLGFGYWAVFDKTSGEFIGECGFADFHRDITPSLRGIPELGYAVMPNAHGTGIASEMVSGAQQKMRVVASGMRERLAGSADQNNLCIVTDQDIAITKHLSSG